MKTSKQAPIQILLADDDKDDRYFFEKALKKVPINSHLKTVVDGEKLMDYLTEEKEHLPDVIFLDINMPRKNGHVCLEEIKNNKKLSAIPVVIYSTSLRADAVDKVYENGAHYYLRKCDFLQLPKSIETVLAMLDTNPKQPSRNKFILELQNS